MKRNNSKYASMFWNTFVGWIQGLSKSDKFAWAERKNFLAAYDKSKEVLEQALVNRFGVVK